MARGTKNKVQVPFSEQLPAFEIQVKTHYHRGRCTAGAHAPGSGCKDSWGPEQCKIVFKSPNGNEYAQCVHVRLGT